MIGIGTPISQSKIPRPMVISSSCLQCLFGTIDHDRQTQTARYSSRLGQTESAFAVRLKSLLPGVDQVKSAAIK